MASRLSVTVIINSSVEDVLGWKCCNLQDLNLEIHVTNLGSDEVKIGSAMELQGEGGAERIDYFYPHGVHAIEPREGLSFYCRFDEERFGRFTQVVVFDEAGKGYRARITGKSEAAEEDRA
jgi:hypothetical protein